MKAIVLGMDGAAPGLIERGVDRGELPGFARMMAEGAWGPLRSTVPAESPQAWTSFATGVNPGRHGVFGFMIRRPGAYGCEIGSSAAVRAPALWQLASSEGLRVGVINVPFTYPPRALNGFVVAGMMTPDLQSPFTYPPDLRDALLRAVPDYRITHGLGRTQLGDPRKTLVRDSPATLAAREKAMRWLADRDDPDLLVCVFTVLDRLQHFLWADMDERHPAHDQASASDCREAIATGYRQLDGILVRTLEAAGEETLVVVVSDHGFEGVARTFYANAWLAERGFLALTGAPDEPSAWTRRLARAGRRAVATLPGGDRVRERLRARRLLSDAFIRAIDWPRTRAWFGQDRGVWLNIAGREPQGIVQPGKEYEQLREQLAVDLESLEDPETGQRLVAKVHRREEIYTGPETGNAPDLIIEPARNTDDYSGRYVLSERLGFDGPGRFTGPSAPISGHHTSEGVLFLRGPGVRAGARIAQAGIVDVAPTIMSALGLPGAEAMNGRPLDSIFERPREPAVARPAARAGSAEHAEPPAVSDDDRRRIEERLQDLGYLD
jgi:predicted AlkP superfamily phosphohydrolase/phosphomutase